MQPSCCILKLLVDGKKDTNNLKCKQKSGGTYMSVGNKIANARKMKNLTQEQLADLLNVTRQSISRWESNQTYPDMENIVFLAEILDVSCDYLLTDKTRVKEEGKHFSQSTITRLLFGAKGKSVKLFFYEDAKDDDIGNKECVITDFDGQWMYVKFKKRKSTEVKLIPISSILSITFVRDGE